MALRNVAVPAGDIYPNGLNIVPLNADVQTTVRPSGWMFRKSPGYETLRPGKFDFSKLNHGFGIHFTPMRYAEDVGSTTDAQGYPLLVDKSKAAHGVDLADLPGSERLDDQGNVTPYESAGGRGVMLSDDKEAPVGSSDIRESEKTLADFGDREIGRPISRSIHFGETYLKNPVGMFRSDWHDSPVKAVAIASAIVGAVYYIGSNLEREWRSRRAGGATGAVGAAAAAPVAAAGGAVEDATDAANRAATAAGDAAAAAASAAGDAASAAGDAASSVTDAVADAVKSD